MLLFEFEIYKWNNIYVFKVNKMYRYAVLLSKCYISFKIKKKTVCKNFHFITYKMIKKQKTKGIILIMINYKISNRVL